MISDSNIKINALEEEPSDIFTNTYITISIRTVFLNFLSPVSTDSFNGSMNQKSQ